MTPSVLCLCTGRHERHGQMNHGICLATGTAKTKSMSCNCGYTTVFCMVRKTMRTHTAWTLTQSPKNCTGGVCTVICTVCNVEERLCCTTRKTNHGAEYLGPVDDKREHHANCIIPAKPAKNMPLAANISLHNCPSGPYRPSCRGSWA